MKRSIVREKSYAFALKIIQLYKEMYKTGEYTISNQLLRSGTSIGANVEEATAGQSRKDFLAKMSIASKEARETNYWLRLLRDSELYPSVDVSDLLADSDELVKILTSIVKTGQKINF